MLQKIAFITLWLLFILYAFILAPPDQPNTLQVITDLSTGKWAGINPIIISLFNIMGIWPMIYLALILMDGRGQKIPAWPFAALSFGVGAFAILPYLAFRQPYPNFQGEKNLLLKLLDSRITGVILAIATLLILSGGVLKGDWSDFVHQWQTSRFIHVMSLDFCLLCLLFPALLGDDLARRGIKNPAVFWAVALVPLFGPLIYLCVRPPLQDQDKQLTTQLT